MAEKKITPSSGVPYTLVEGTLKDEDREEVQEMANDLTYAAYGVKNIRVKVKYWKNSTGTEYPSYTLIFNTSAIKKRDIEQFEGKGWTVGDWSISYILIRHWHRLDGLEVSLEVSH